MSSLAEINQRLIEQNNEQERTSVAIEDVRKALIAQMKTERRGRLDELEAAKRARPTGGFVSGVAQGIGEASGLGALGRLFTGIMGALFGGGTLAALTTSIGRFIGRGTFIGAAAALVKQFGEDGIKSLFDELAKAGLDFGLTNEQQDEIARRGSDVIFAALITGLVTKNPLVRLATGIVYAFRDHIYTYLENWFGIKITKFEDGSVQVSIPGLDKTLTPTESQLDLALAGIATAVSLGVYKLGKTIVSKLYNTFIKADDAATKAFKKIVEDVGKLQADFEADRARNLDMQRRLDAQAGSRTQAGQNLADDLARLEDSLRSGTGGTRSSARGDVARARRSLQEFRALQNINAQPLDIAPKVSTSAPVQPDSPAVKATSDLAKLGDVAIEEAGFSRKVAKDGRVLYFTNTGGFASPNIVLDATKRIQADKQAKKAKTKANIGKGLGVAGLALEGAFIASDVGAELKGTEGPVSAAQVGQIVQKQAEANIFGGTIDAITGFARFIEEQTLVRAGLISAPVTPQTELEKRMVEASERRLELEEQVGADAWRLGTILGLNKISGEGAKDALITLGDAADKAGENILKTFSGEESVSPYASMSQADYLKLSSEGFSGSTAPGYSMPAPVIIQDQSVRQGGSNTTVTNQIDTPIQSFDASWYQRRAAMGLGL